MLNNLENNVSEEIGLVTPTPGLVEAYLQFRIRYFHFDWIIFQHCLPL